MSVPIDQDFPGSASHCNTFAILLSRVFSSFDFSIKVSVKSFHVGILSSK